MTWTIVTAAAITLLVLGIGGGMTTVGPWYWNLRKPAWNPPDWIFGPAWTAILALAAWAGVLAWTGADAVGHARIAALFAVNIALHMAWTPLFFNLRRPDWALVEVPFLWLSVLALMVGLAPYSAAAPWLLLPYLLWVGFAAWLNLTIVRMNRPFGRAAAPCAGAAPTSARKTLLPRASLQERSPADFARGSRGVAFSRHAALSR